MCFINLLVAILPMNEELCVIEITGQQLIDAMENSVSQVTPIDVVL